MEGSLHVSPAAFSVCLLETWRRRYPPVLIGQRERPGVGESGLLILLRGRGDVTSLCRKPPREPCPQRGSVRPNN